MTGEASRVEVSVVIPVYNSEPMLAELVRRLGEVFVQLERSYEIVLVDDGSSDGSWQKISELHAGGAPIRAFRFMRNHGQHYALKCGLDHAQGRLVVTMDDDLQHPPEEIPRLLAELEARPDVDVVSGKYTIKRHSLFRNLGTFFITRLERALFHTDKNVTMSSFRLLRGAVVDEVRQVRHAQPRIGPIILSITNRIASVPVRHEPRRHGRSGYDLRRLVRDTFDSVMNYSALPLQVVSIVGLSTAVLSFVLAAVYLVGYLTGEVTVSGFTTIVLLILFSSGAILFSFGLVGEYLRRIVSQQLMSAQYHVRNELPRASRHEQAADRRAAQ